MSKITKFILCLMSASIGVGNICLAYMLLTSELDLNTFIQVYIMTGSILTTIMTFLIVRNIIKT